LKDLISYKYIIKDKLQGLPRDVLRWLLQSLADPCPFPFLEVLHNGNLPSSPPEVLVLNHLWPYDVEDVAEALVDEGLQLVGLCLRGAPFHKLDLTYQYNLYMSKVLSEMFHTI
jgi:hypothetical protein